MQDVMSGQDQDKGNRTLGQTQDDLRRTDADTPGDQADVGQPGPDNPDRPANRGIDHKRADQRG